MTANVRPIAWVVSSRAEPTDDHWASESSRIVLDDSVPDEALAGIENFSHLEVIGLANAATDTPPAPWSRHPRGNEAWPLTGIFAQRNKDRPNRLLLSVVRLSAREGRELVVQDLDFIDGTPILDIKPVFRWTQATGEIVAPSWSDELGENYF